MNCIIFQTSTNRLKELGSMNGLLVKTMRKGRRDPTFHCLKTQRNVEKILNHGFLSCQTSFRYSFLCARKRKDTTLILEMSVRKLLRHCCSYSLRILTISGWPRQREKQEGRPCARVKAKKKEGRSGVRFGGYSQAGIDRYNELYDKIEDSRATTDGKKMENDLMNEFKKLSGRTNNGMMNYDLEENKKPRFDDSFLTN